MLKKNSKFLVIIILFCSAGLWLAGILQPMLTMSAKIDKKIIVVQCRKILDERKSSYFLYNIGNQILDNIKLDGYFHVHKKTSSILQTASDLYKKKFFLVAGLILLFSLIIPALKILLLLFYLFTNNNLFIRLNSYLSKWSLADVFAVGVLIAFLAAKSPTDNEIMLQFDAHLHTGFYWFVAYCLVSQILGLLLKKLLVSRSELP